tara:strand:+ start:1083 stop:1364 length:282 start_codon:yes stop_codon:yes gene_type:complete
MNYVEIKIGGETCRVSWEPNVAFSDEPCDHIDYIMEIVKQTLLGVGYSPKTVDEYFQPNEEDVDAQINKAMKDHITRELKRNKEMRDELLNDE